MLALAFWRNNKVTVLHGKVTWHFAVSPETGLEFMDSSLTAAGCLAEKRTIGVDRVTMQTEDSLLNNGAVRTKQLEIRSKLFVPGSKPQLFPRAASGQADAISFDLEDAVPLSHKDEARHAVAEYLIQEGAKNGKINIVRVNSVASGLFDPDLERVIVSGLHVLNLPKVQDGDDVLAAVDALEYWERKAGLTEEIGLLATIESPKGLRMALAIATAHPRMVGLQIGMVDFNLACGFESGNRTAVNAVRLATRLAASEAGIAVFDGAFVKVSDPQAFRAEAEEAHALGLNGKSCIHPSQVSVVNEIFSPGVEEIERAVRLLAAAESASARGDGAFLHDGDMVDLPVVKRARGLLARAGQRTPPGGTESK
jgi:citrate lyase subunit beta / citryl-CoA lyase